MERNWHWVDVEYYRGHIEDSKIIVSKLKKKVRSNKLDLFKQTHHTTKQDALDSLKPVLIKAEEKFRICVEAFDMIKHNLNFNVGYHMEGDTYGIHTDYMYIDFTIDGIRCKFRID